MAGILDGIRVVEWADYHAGPGAAATLGDLGAEIIKIEARISGDRGRSVLSLGKLPLKLRNGHSLWFEGSNRNKKSITLDIAKPEGKALAYRLVEHADVFITNHRQGLVALRGMDYDSLRQRNPRLVYLRVSAYGRNGPDADQGGFDFLGQARSGFMTAIGEPAMPPLYAHLAIVDQVTAFTASYGVIAALLARERTGIGQEVHASLLGSSSWLLYFNILCHQLLGTEPPKHDRKRPGGPLRNYYCCQDGKWLASVHWPEQKYWPAFCRMLGIPNTIVDPRFDTDAKRAENEELVAILDHAFAQKRRSEWLDLAREAELMLSPVNSVSDLPDDPQFAANDYIVEVDIPGLGLVKVPGFPVQFSANPAAVRSGAPSLGAHTDEVLGEVLGLSMAEIDALRTAEIV